VTNMNCESCATTNPAEALFCIRCGKRLDTNANTTAAIPLSSARAILGEAHAASGVTAGRAAYSQEPARGESLATALPSSGRRRVRLFTAVFGIAALAAGGYVYRRSVLGIFSAQLYRKACDGGNAAGCTNLGCLYDDGEGTAKDAAQAVARYRKGCDGGNAGGCTTLGVISAYGDGAAKDAAQAVALYRKGCDGGNAAGCINLGVMYANGDGVAKDAAQAVALYRKACDGGDAR